MSTVGNKSNQDWEKLLGLLRTTSASPSSVSVPRQLFDKIEKFAQEHSDSYVENERLVAYWSKKAEDLEVRLQNAERKGERSDERIEEQEKTIKMVNGHIKHLKCCNKWILVAAGVAVLAISIPLIIKFR